MGITTRQKQIVDFIERCQRQDGFPPSLRDMCAALGLASPGSLLRHLQVLESEGYLTRFPGKKRTWRLTNRTSGISIPLIGRIAAGQPILAEHSVEDNLPFDPQFFGSKEAFALLVKGDSMTGEQIYAMETWLSYASSRMRRMVRSSRSSWKEWRARRH